MYKRILIPTDGSPLAGKAIKAGVELAAQLGATVVGYHAFEPIEITYYNLGTGGRASEVKAIQKQLREAGHAHLAQVRAAAQAQGVACETVTTNPATPYQGIIDAARQHQCDVIFMASHGRGTMASLLLGNVTQKVLAHSKLPVLVYR